ncbi:hypothetical protein J789_2807 [Acinetobacter baumannii 44895_6]|nr:Hypothetical protein ABK1_1896 [Acinetobacter baumannii 1656-2]AVN04287.1 hypothetical protein C7R87_1026 [Acinetobacter baumannii]EXB02049.1 hypothetical protein J519_1232 [Acinetobacter baumannii 1294217]EXB61608.1 hypothetical protein J548_0037 [Acinetobacter baumannii 1465485]EXC49775.1 hypothetical protein J485_0571 [Acinetobacter baumannii 1031433]EXC85916.1 hypothetical protein J468_0424 [Acinetobacter baumannii 1043903]EXD19307.1 hypothetical protein J457_1148 [Acinetobacter bauman
MEKVTKKLCHLQNLLTVFIYQEMLQKHYFYKLWAGCR